MGSSCKSESISWNQLGISNTIFHSMDYRNYQIKIYESVDNANKPIAQRKFFYAPIVLLNHESATYIHNRVTQRHEMYFKIEMWNKNLQTMAVSELTKVKKNSITPSQVNIIPIEDVILVSNVPCYGYQLPTEWTSYSQSPQSVEFTLICDSQSKAKELVENMHENPKCFNDFRILLRLTSSNTQKQETIIRIENILSGNLMSTLLQKFPKEVLLTADDEKRLLKESSTEILIQTFSDFQTVAVQGEERIYNILKDLLVASREIIKEENDEKWKSVFWNDDNYRPDKTSSFLNEEYKKLDKEDQKKLRDCITTSGSGEGNAELGKVLNIFKSLTLSGKGRNSNSTLHSNFDLNKLLDESRKHVEWQGEKFVPRQLSLAKINVAELGDNKLFTDRKTVITYTPGCLSTNINIDDIRHPESFRLTLVQIDNDANKTFMKAHSNMERIQIQMAQVPGYVQESVKIIRSDNKSAIEKMLIVRLLEKIREAAVNGEILSKEVANGFDQLIELISQVLSKEKWIEDQIKAATEEQKKCQMSNAELNHKKDEAINLLKQKMGHLSKMQQSWDGIARYFQTVNKMISTVTSRKYQDFINDAEIAKENTELIDILSTAFLQSCGLSH